MTAYLGANLHHTDKRLQQSGPAVPRPRPTVTPTLGHATQPRSMGGGRRRRAPHQYSPRGRGLPAPGPAPAQRGGWPRAGRRRAGARQGAGRAQKGRGGGRSRPAALLQPGPTQRPSPTASSCLPRPRGRAYHLMTMQEAGPKALQTTPPLHPPPLSERGLPSRVEPSAPLAGSTGCTI